MPQRLPTLPFKTFLTYSELTAFCRKLAAAKPNLCRVSSLGKSRESREVHFLTVTDFRTGRPEDKPAYLLHGNIHAAELAGTHASLYTARQLLTDRKAASLLKHTTFYIVPRLNPDGAELAVTVSMPIRSRREMEKTAPNTVYPEDIDGNGLILSMVKEDPNGDHCFDDEDPRLVRRRYHDSEGPFYRFYVEGSIHAWDGGDDIKMSARSYDWNRNWSYDWRPEPEQSGAGDFPFSEIEMRHLGRFIMAQENLFAILDYHTGMASLLTPPSTGRVEDVDYADREIIMRIAERGAELTGLPVFPVVKLGRKGTPDINLHGHSEDFVYRHRGVHGYGIELGNMLDSAGLSTDTQRSVGSEKERETLWRRVLSWWDAQDPRTREPLFVDWHPFDHPQLGPVLIGGFITRNQHNPTLAWTRKLAPKTYAFTLEHASWAPHVRIEDVETECVGGKVFRIRIRVTNRGRLPTHVTKPGRTLRCVKPVRVEFDPGRGVELLSRQGHLELGHLEGVTGSRTLEWFVRRTGRKTPTVDIRVWGGAGGNDCRTVELEEDTKK